MRKPAHFNEYTLKGEVEAAASRRGPPGDRWFWREVDDHGVPMLTWEHGQPFQEPPAGTVLLLHTEAQQPHRPQVTCVEIAADHGVTHRLEEKYDAVFWSEGAVEKFVFPYLASKSLWLAAHNLADISRKWYGFVPAPPAPPGPGEEREEEIPFAIAHTPDSEFQEVSDSLHLLFRGEGGTVRAVPLRTWVAEREAADRGTGDRGTQTPASPGGG